jgi:hypothetical protein
MIKNDGVMGGLGGWDEWEKEKWCDRDHGMVGPWTSNEDGTRGTKWDGGVIRVVLHTHNECPLSKKF